MPIWLQKLLPQRALGRIVYRAVRWRWGPFKNALIRWFVSSYRVDLSDAARKEPAAFASFNDFFTRELEPNARTWPDQQTLWGAPADGTLTQHGAITKEGLVQAKGVHYSIDEFLGKPTGGRFIGGQFATIYLAPYNYHRIHMPVGAELTRWRLLAGARYSVNEKTAELFPGLFTTNERLVVEFATDHGMFALVMVSALNVASITLSVVGELPQGRDSGNENCSINLARGDELGRFNLGSTVVLVAEPGCLQLNPSLVLGQTISLGDLIGGPEAVP